MRRYVMEFVGTFFLTMAVVMTGNPIAIGLMVMAMVYVGGHISGGHFNPAISLAVFLKKHLTLNDMLFYFLAQTLGACVAIGLFFNITNSIFVPEMVPGLGMWNSLVQELCMALALCWVVLTMVATARYKGGIIAGMAIGMTVVAIAFFGGLYNPAIATASMCCSIIKGEAMFDMDKLLVFKVGPLLGGAIACHLFNYLNQER